MTWFSLRVEPGSHRDEIIAALFDQGVHGVQEEGATLLTHFASETQACAAAGAVAALELASHCEIQAVDDADWSTAWQEQLRTYALGDLTIAPPWLASRLDPARTVVIDPGMAFGTGDHPSTRGAARLLTEVVRPDLVVADLGTGSAVLAIAAAKLGAARVFAVEVDPDALGNARDNIERNGVTGTVHLVEGDAQVLLPLLAPVDVVVANILGSVIVRLLPAMTRALRRNGSAVLAGLLVAERRDLLGILRARGWRVSREDVEEEWWSALITRS